MDWQLSMFEIFVEVEGVIGEVDEYTCLTFVVQDDLFLKRFARQLLVAATGSKTTLKADDDLGFYWSKVEQAISSGSVFLPKSEVRRVRSVADLEQFAPDHRIDLITNNDRDLVRVYKKSMLRHVQTDIGELYQLELSGRAVLRVLELTPRGMQSGDYVQLARKVSQELPIGVQEQVWITRSGHLVSQSEHSLLITRQDIEELTFLNLFVQVESEYDYALLQHAFRVLYKKFGRVSPLSKGHRKGRIPDVLPAAELITTLPHDWDVSSNTVIQRVTGIAESVVLYGATDIGGNWVELLQLFVAALRSGRPGVFNIESRAHNLGAYWDRILYPSLSLLGNGTYLPEHMRQIRLDELSASDLVNSLGLVLPEHIKRMTYQGVGSFYRTLHRFLVDQFNIILGTNVQLAVVESERLFEPAMKGITIGEAVAHIWSVFDTDRVFANFYGPHGEQEQIRLSEIKEQEFSLSIVDYLHGPGAWPGGVLNYLMMAYLAHYGMIIYDLKDSRLGEVALAATVEDSNIGCGANQAEYTVSGVTRCYPAIGSSGGDNIDPLVLAVLLHRYPKEISQLIRSMSERWVFPVDDRRVGEVQIYTVGHQASWEYSRYFETNNAQRR